MEHAGNKGRMIRRAAVLGGGAWGTTMAWLLSSRVDRIELLCHEPELVEAINAGRGNILYLPDLALPASIHASGDPAEALHGAELVVFAVPSSAARAVATRVAEFFPATADLLNIAKGFDEDACRPLSAFLAESFRPARLAVLSGPNLAREIAAGLPGSTVIASRDQFLAQELQELLRSRTFRVYVSDDPLGVELGGALKNIYALAAGICDGLGFGDNSKAALLTRCIAEMTRLGETLGARRETFMGLSGMGDLVATSCSPQSRNRSVGEALGRGKSLAGACASIVGLAEGVTTVRVVMKLARQQKLELPVAAEVEAILDGRTPAWAAVERLMSRAPREEFWS